MRKRETRILDMQHLFRLPQNQLTQERGFLLSRVSAERVDKRSLAIAQGELYEVLANKGGVRVHGWGFELVGGNAGRESGGWVRVFDAAVIGLAYVLAAEDRRGGDALQEEAEQRPDGEEGPEEIGVHWSLLDRAGLEFLDPDFVGLGAGLADDFHLPEVRQVVRSWDRKHLTIANGTEGAIGLKVRVHGSLLLELQQPESDESDDKADSNSHHLVVEVAQDCDISAEVGKEDAGEVGHSDLHLLLLRAQEDSGVIQLHLGRDAAGYPVLDALHSTLLFVKAEQLRNLGRSAESFNEVFVGHGDITHHV